MRPADGEDPGPNGRESGAALGVAGGKSVKTREGEAHVPGKARGYRAAKRERPEVRGARDKLNGEHVLAGIVK